MIKTCFFFNDTATTEIYTLSLHDALPICFEAYAWQGFVGPAHLSPALTERLNKSLATALRHPETRAKLEEIGIQPRSEEHTSELQSHSELVCRLLLDKKPIDSKMIKNKGR